MLMKWILGKRGLDPKLVPMGPDIESMLEECDGALIIGDRALSAAISNPDLVRMDLGSEWTKITGLPMVFGVFATRSDSPPTFVNKARDSMLSSYRQFLDEENLQSEVISIASQKIALPKERVAKYFESEVSNILDEPSLEGLQVFLDEVCGMRTGPSWFQSD